MRFNFSPHVFFFILLLSPFTITGNFQNVFGLTPVADLTGEWSGFGQFIEFSSCQQTVKLNASIKQKENQITGTYNFVSTGSKQLKADVHCYQWNPTKGTFVGTIDGSRISVTLSDDGLLYTGSYASSGIKLSVQSDWLTGTIQLSPTNFTPPPFEPKDEKKEPVCNQGEVLVNGKCVPKEPTCKPDEVLENGKCVSKAQQEAEKERLAAEKAEKERLAQEADSAEVDTLLKKVMEIPPKPEDWAVDEGDPFFTETKPKFPEPPSPLVLPVTEEAKPYLKALWDGKCDTLSHQYGLVTGKSGQVPFVCTGGKITLQSGDQIEFSVADDWGVKVRDLYIDKVKAIAVTYVVTQVPPLAMFTPLTETYGKIQDMKALHLTLKTGETELLGGLIQIKTKCLFDECRFIKTEEEGGGFKFYELPSSLNKETKEIVTELAHGSVYILVEYTPEVTQEKTSAVTEKPTTTVTEEKPAVPAENGGCLIATATYGSELAPQVQLLRELRDNTVLGTQSGASFMTAFNTFYYSFSPVIADWERQNPAFKEFVKVTITPLLSSLSLLQYVDIDSEAEMLGYGIGIMLLNIGLYFIVPTVVIMKVCKLIKNKVR